MMEPESSLFDGQDSPERSRRRRRNSLRRQLKTNLERDPMVMEEVSLESDVQTSERVFKFLNKIEEKGSSVVDFSLRFDCEKDIDLLEGSISEKLRVLEEKEIDFDLAQLCEASLMSLVFENQIEQVVTHLDAQENKLRLLLRELDKAEKDFVLRQRAEIERRVEESKQLEGRKNELRSLEDVIEEKSVELKRKEETFELRLKEEGEKLREESELKSKHLEVMEKTLVKRFKELELKEKELDERSKQQLVDAESRKRSNLEHEPTLLVSCNARQAKKHKFHEADDDGDKDHKPLTSCPATKFNDFRKSMSDFDVGQVWALHDPMDDMPRIYAEIRTVFSSQMNDLCLQVTILEHVQATKDKRSTHNACGRFEYKDTEIKSHLMFVHEMHHIKRGNDVIVNPREGETWALFRDWNITWKDHSHLHEPPFRYDFVEVISDFDDDLGISVAYMGKVKGFVSVFYRDGLIKIINPEEMQRFSHKVASVKLRGGEKEGVPAGSFELDPVATPSYDHVLKKVVETKTQSRKCGGKAPMVKNEDGITKDHPIIID